jgi:hypothetical protein
MDTVPANVDWRACTATPLSGLADYMVRLKLLPHLFAPRLHTQSQTLSHRRLEKENARDVGGKKISSSEPAGFI